MIYYNEADGELNNKSYNAEANNILNQNNIISKKESIGKYSKIQNVELNSFDNNPKNCTSCKENNVKDSDCNLVENNKIDKKRKKI